MNPLGSAMAVSTYAYRYGAARPSNAFGHGPGRHSFPATIRRLRVPCRSAAGPAPARRRPQVRASLDQTAAAA